jgi:hypothetical protein
MGVSECSKPDFYQALWYNILSLHDDWAFYVQLFGHGPERVEKLNLRTGQVFRKMQDRLLDAVLLGIGRLLDPAESKRRDGLAFNLCLDKAIAQLSLPKGDARETALKSDVKRIREKFAPIIVQRHKRVAHNDLAVAMDLVAIDGVSRIMVSEAIASIEDLFNRITDIRDGTQYSFEPSFLQDPKAEVDRLLRVVDSGNRQLDLDKKARRDRYMQQYGVTMPEKFDPGEEWARRQDAHEQAQKQALLRERLADE